MSAELPLSESIPAPNQDSVPASGHFKAWLHKLCWHRRNIPLLLILASLLVCAWRYRITRPEYRLGKGEVAIQEKDWAEAIELAKKLESSGNLDEAHWLLAQVHFARKQHELALEECDKVQSEGKYGVQASVVAGKCLLELGALVEAKRRLISLVKSHPDTTDAHRTLAVIAYDLGQYSDAVYYLEQVIRLDPEDARPHRLLGEIYRDSANDELAVSEFKECLRLKNELSELAVDQVRFEIADGLLKLFRYAEALEAVEAAAADGRPQPLYMQAIRADCLRGLGRRAEAVQLVDKLLASDPGAFFFRLRGQLYMDEGDAKSAVPMLERSVSLAPRHYQSHVLLAQAYTGVGRTQDAARTQARAEVLRKEYEHLSEMSREANENPWDPFVRLRLAEFYRRIGDSRGANAWQKAAEQCMAIKR